MYFFTYNKVYYINTFIHSTVDLYVLLFLHDLAAAASRKFIRRRLQRFCDRCTCLIIIHFVNNAFRYKTSGGKIVCSPLLACRLTQFEYSQTRVIGCDWISLLSHITARISALDKIESVTGAPSHALTLTSVE